jgi:hypothetical protein
VTLRIAQPCGCEQDAYMGQKREKRCRHRNLFEKPGASIRRNPYLKRSKTFAASKVQQEKVKLLPCAHCGTEGDQFNPIDPAHLWPRSKGGCNHPNCVIPLCRSCHRIYDPSGGLELLPALVSKGYFAELAHPISAHEVSPNELVRHLTLDPSPIKQGAAAPKGAVR